MGKGERGKRGRGERVPLDFPFPLPFTRSPVHPFPGFPFPCAPVYPRRTMASDMSSTSGDAAAKS
jgi:hypothetical protein